MAAQVVSTARYLAAAQFITWDVHKDDVLIDHGGHVTFLDIFMGPSECLTSTDRQGQGTDWRRGVGLAQPKGSNVSLQQSQCRQDWGPAPASGRKSDSQKTG